MTEGIRSFHLGEGWDLVTVFQYLNSSCKEDRSCLFSRNRIVKTSGSRYKLPQDRRYLHVQDFLQ